jgi:Domain of unknown function (DUF4249)
MASNFKTTLGLFFIGFLCLRCEKTRFYAAENLPDVLFVRGHIDPDFGAEVLVTKAVSTSDTVYLKDLLMRNASVYIADEAGKRQRVPPEKDGRYKIGPEGLELKTGVKYRIEVSVPGLPEAVSEWVAIPELIVPDTLWAKINGKGYSAILENNLEFEDQNPGRDHYFLSILGHYNQITEPTFNNIFNAVQVCEAQYGLEEIAFDDRCLNGQGRAVCQITCYAVFSRSGQNDFYQRVTYRFGKSSPEYQAYLLSLERPVDWDYALLEPPVTFSNIKGGLGVFFATNTRAKTIVL